MKKYEINKVWKFAEEDSFEDGCKPDTALQHEVALGRITGDTQEDVLRNLCVALDVVYDINKFQINACDDPGRVDLSVLEDSDAMEVNIEHKIYAMFKEGNAQLWCATYTVYVERVIRETIELDALPAVTK